MNMGRKQLPGNSRQFNSPEFPDGSFQDDQHKE
jgi:hypothetical protein